MSAQNFWMRWRLLPLLTVVLLFVVACTALPTAPGATPLPPETTPEAVPTPAGGMPPAGNAAAVDAARATLAVELGRPLAEIGMVSVEPVDWRDGCLEVSRPDVMCLQVITPGYRIILKVDGQQFEMRTDAEGRVVVRTGTPAADAPVGAVVKALAQLASQLGLELNEVRVVSAERVDWPDACLGAAAEDEMCAQVITPGYRIVLEANQRQYIFHTDETGAALRPGATAGSAGTPEPEAITGWRQIDAAGCVEAFLAAEGIRFGKCGEELTVAEFPAATHRQAQLLDMQAIYAPFAADTPAGKVVFKGRGALQAGPAEQRMMAEWAAAVYSEVQTGAAEAPLGLSWLREGGIAGFCDDLTIDASGHAVLRSCARKTVAAAGWRRLTEAELARFYGWLDTLGAFEHRQTDKAQADAMTIAVFFAGRGGAQPTAEVEAFSVFAGDVLAQWAGPSEVRYVIARQDVNVRTGPGEQFAMNGQIAAGQTALVTGVSRDGAWWRVVCSDDTVGACFVTADPTVTEAVAPPPTPGATPGADATDAADTAEILAAVIRRVYQVDHTFAEAPNFRAVYLLHVDDAETGATPFGSTPAELDAAVREQIIAALSDLPAQLTWAPGPNDVPRNANGLVEGNGAIITVGKPRPQADGSVQIAASIYIGALAAGGQTYILQKVDGAWEITGKIGPVWIS